MKRLMSGYARLIEDDLKTIGRHDVDPRHVEAYLRLEYRSLDSLSRGDFLIETKGIVGAIDVDPIQAEQLAQSFGF